MSKEVFERRDELVEFLTVVVNGDGRFDFGYDQREALVDLAEELMKEGWVK